MRHKETLNKATEALLKAKENKHEREKEKEEIKKSDVLKDAPTSSRIDRELMPSVKTEVAVAEKPKLEPLQPGQKYFEAPDGTLIIGEADKQQLWHRKLNDGRGGWINPKR